MDDSWKREGCGVEWEVGEEEEEEGEIYESWKREGGVEDNGN